MGKNEREGSGGIRFLMFGLVFEVGKGEIKSSYFLYAYFESRRGWKWKERKLRLTKNF